MQCTTGENDIRCFRFLDSNFKLIINKSNGLERKYPIRWNFNFSACLPCKWSCLGYVCFQVRALKWCCCCLACPYFKRIIWFSLYSPLWWSLYYYLEQKRKIIPLFKIKNWKRPCNRVENLQLQVFALASSHWAASSWSFLKASEYSQWHKTR